MTGFNFHSWQRRLSYISSAFWSYEFGCVEPWHIRVFIANRILPSNQIISVGLFSSNNSKHDPPSIINGIGTHLLRITININHEIPDCSRSKRVEFILKNNFLGQRSLDGMFSMWHADNSRIFFQFSPYLCTFSSLKI